MAEYRLPDLFVVGAQKSGTTAVCTILDQHPDITLSIPKEPMFLCRDELELHACFFLERTSEWDFFDWTDNRDAILKRYARCFPDCPRETLLGEGSTTYMYSKRAPERIFSINPDAKIIFILRDPVDRAYSAYWHYVHKGTVFRKFENQLRFDSENILSMGLYQEKIENYRKRFPDQQIYYELFERFKENPEKRLKKLMEFLDVDSTVELREEHGRLNTAKAPRFYNTQLLLNLLKQMSGGKYAAEDQFDVHRNDRDTKVFNILNKLSKYNLTKKTYPEMKEDVKKILKDFYKRENRDIAKITGINVDQYWNSFLPFFLGVLC